MGLVDSLGVVGWIARGVSRVGWVGWMGWDGMVVLGKGRSGGGGDIRGGF